MKTRGANWLLLLFFIAAALVLASLLAQLTVGVPALKWLTYGERIGFDALQINLAVLDFSIAFHFSANVAQILLLAVALIVYRKVART